MLEGPDRPLFPEGVPMGLGMAAVNAGVLIMPGGVQGNQFLDPMVTDTDQLMNILQID